jgi:hypothetical protein
LTPEPFVHDRSPRDERELTGVLDERVLAGDKLRRSGKVPRNAFASIRNVERQAGLAFERLSGALDFSPF